MDILFYCFIFILQSAKKIFAIFGVIAVISSYSSTAVYAMDKRVKSSGKHVETQEYPYNSDLYIARASGFIESDYTHYTTVKLLKNNVKVGEVLETSEKKYGYGKVSVDTKWCNSKHAIRTVAAFQAQVFYDFPSTSVKVK